MNNYGFTLIELLVVIAIIGTLSTIGFIALTASQQGADDAVKVSDLRTIRSALEINYISQDAFPASPGACVTGSTGALATALDGKVENVNWDNIFYCTNTAGRDIAGATVATKKVNTQYVIGTTLSDASHTVLTSDYDDPVYIRSAANATQCAAAVFCLTSDKL